MSLEHIEEAQKLGLNQRGVASAPKSMNFAFHNHFIMFMSFD